MTELVIAGVVLLLLSRSTSQATGGDSGGGGGSSGDGGLDVGGIVGAAGTIVGALGGGGGAALGGGGVALGGGGAGAALGGGGGGAAATGGATAGGIAATGAVGSVTVGLIANPFLWVIYVTVGTLISRWQTEAKNFDLRVWRLGANARALHEFERSIWETAKDERTLGGRVVSREVRDGRLDYQVNAPGGQVNFQGWRTVLTYIPATGIHELHNGGFRRLLKRIRAAGLVYLQERARYGEALLRSRLSRQPPAEGYAPDSFSLGQLFERIEPGYGGLAQLPLLDGEVEAGYRDDESQPFPPAAQARGVDTDPLPAELTIKDLHCAKVTAVLDLVVVYQSDARLFLGSPEEYARTAWQDCGRPGGVHVSGRYWILEPEVFGNTYKIDFWGAHTRTVDRWLEALP